MQPVEHFNPYHRQPSRPSEWDRFRLHHIFTDRNLVVHFETGEMCITTRYRGRTEENDYRLYRDRNIILVSTTSAEFTSLLKQHEIALLNPDTKKPLPASWLQQQTDGTKDQQMMVIDLDHMVAVNMRPSGAATNDDPRRDWFKRTPMHIQKAPGVYYPNPQAAPEGYSVRLTRPYEMTSEEKNHLASLKQACAAWWEMSGWAEQVKADPALTTWQRMCKGDNLELYRHTRNSVTLSMQPMDWMDLKDRTFNEMLLTQRYRLLYNGAVVNRVPSMHPYLHVAHV